MIPQIELTPKITVTATKYGTDKYQYVRNDRYYAIIEEISIANDGTFRDVGDLKASLKGQPWTSQGGVSDEIRPMGYITARYNGPFYPVLRPGESFEVDFKVESGSAEVQVNLQVILVSRAELDVLIENGAVAMPGGL